MYLVLIAWLYVTVLMAVAEATSPPGSLMGAIITFTLYGLLPMGIMGYILGTPGRKRALHARAMAEREAQSVEVESGSAEPDAGRHAPAAAEDGAVAPVRKEA